jgi:signal transduction histidine kinase
MELYSPQERSERVVAMSRLVLASCSLLAVWLDPAEGQYGFAVRALLTAYVLYSAVIAALSGLSIAPPFLHRLPSHVVDLAAVSGVVLLSAGRSCPLLPLFIFVLLEASLRWHRRGRVWTAIGTLGVFTVIGGYQRWAQPSSFELNEFLIRCASLAVIALVLDQVGTYERQLRRHVHALATEVDAPLDETDRLVSALLEWAARVVDAPRAVLAWEEPDEPWLYLATWQRGKYRLVKEPPGPLAALVTDELAGDDFLCPRRGASVLRATAHGLGTWQGDPLHPAFSASFGVTSVVGVTLKSETATGWLFFLDKPRMTSDDLLMGRVVSRHITRRLNQMYLTRRLKEAAALEERLLVARDLHDGVFHILTGIALSVDTLTRVPAAERERSEEGLRSIQENLEEGQRNLRHLIGALKNPGLSSSWSDSNLDARLVDLFRRLESPWGLRVEPSLSGLDRLPAERSNDVYLMIHEGLINVARHAEASAARLDMAVEDGQVNIAISDDGRGFSFKGLYDHATLAALELGPVTLKERLARLGGSVTIDSSPGANRLQITFPVRLQGA